MERGLFGHPRGLFVLFFVEMWERFSYYGMRAMLVLYVTQQFLFSDERAYGVYGAYTSLVYLAPVLGGFVGDRWLGYRRSVIIGSSLMALGHFCMAFEQRPVFFLALSLLIVGNGFFKANMSTLVGRLYADDPRRDGGYTIFYMAVNVGAWIAPLACGYVGHRFGWHWGFTLAGIGMAVGLINFLFYQRRFGAIGEASDPQALDRPLFGPLSARTAIWIGTAIALVVSWQLLQASELVGYMLVGVGVIVVAGLILYSFRKADGPPRHRIWVALLLTFFSVVFWACFEQQGSSLNLFTDRNVDRVVAGFEIPTPWFQSTNPAFIILLGLPFAWLWVGLRKVRAEPSIPLKFGLGIILLGLGFGSIYFGAWSSRGDGVVPLVWLLLGYLLLTMGELSISPVGLSMISKLAPKEIGGLMMGTWYLSIAYANYMAGAIAKLTSIGGRETAAVAAGASPAETVMVYGGVYGQIAAITVGIGLFVALVAPLVNRGTHGVR